jgi:hypothetical protein
VWLILRGLLAAVFGTWTMFSRQVERSRGWNSHKLSYLAGIRVRLHDVSGSRRGSVRISATAMLFAHLCSWL